MINKYTITDTYVRQLMGVNFTSRRKNLNITVLYWIISNHSRIRHRVKSAGTLSDSFGYQAMYSGINYATKPTLYGKVRFLIGASLVHKQYKKNAEPETKLLPIPALEIKMSKRSVLNISGSPQVDYGNHRNNAVLFFQFKLNIR